MTFLMLVFGSIGAALLVARLVDGTAGTMGAGDWGMVAVFSLIGLAGVWIGTTVIRQTIRLFANPVVQRPQPPSR
jgi:hypothetical protein